MAAWVPSAQQVPALLLACQPSQLYALQAQSYNRQLATLNPVQQPWRHGSRRRRRVVARITKAAALSRPSIEDRLALALDTPAAKELVVELAAAVAFMESTGASVNMAFLLAKDAGRLPADQCRAALATLQPKFRLFQQRCAAAADACDWLAVALVGCPRTQAALALPVADFEAALDFIASQAALLQEFASPGSAAAAGGAMDGLAGAADGSPAAAAAGAAAGAAMPDQPPPLYSFFRQHALTAGALLQQHPAPFLQRTAPWLRQQLGGSDAELAAAALLSGRMPQLCQLDTGLAKSSLDWLIALGLSQQQAGQLLLASLRRPDGDLLTASPAELADRQRRVHQLAAQWRVSPALAAALWLTQDLHLHGRKEEDTGRLLAVLRDEVGMSTAQLLHFALAGGLRGDQAGRSSSLDAALARLKRLLLVFGSWQDVAAALERCPGLLFASDAAVEGLLPQPAQQAMWQVVAQMDRGS